MQNFLKKKINGIYIYKISDFGFLTDKECWTEKLGTKIYSSPEVLDD
jgi:hypothetical protein